MPEAIAGKVRVQAVAPHRVIHDGSAYTAADGPFELPDNETTKRWVRAGWVEPVSTKKASKQ